MLLNSISKSRGNCKNFFWLNRNQKCRNLWKCRSFFFWRAYVVSQFAYFSPEMKKKRKKNKTLLKMGKSINSQVIVDVLCVRLKNIAYIIRRKFRVCWFFFHALKTSWHSAMPFLTTTMMMKYFCKRKLLHDACFCAFLLDFVTKNEFENVCMFAEQQAEINKIGKRIMCSIRQTMNYLAEEPPLNYRFSTLKHVKCMKSRYQITHRAVYGSLNEETTSITKWISQIIKWKKKTGSKTISFFDFTILSTLNSVNFDEWVSFGKMRWPQWKTKR